jgi:hypothetical protein
MGIMLETLSERLLGPGLAHDRAPDKVPARRLRTIALAGKLSIPFTTGILIGIGETFAERVEALIAIRDLHERYGHIQEVIVQNFRRKPGIPMRDHPEPAMDDLLRTAAVARLLLGPDMNIQVPPNLSPGVYARLLAAGLIALEEHPRKLAADHANARFLAEALAKIPGIAVDPGKIQTNIVIFEVSGAGLTAAEFSSRLKTKGVLMNAVSETHLRAVTHYDVNREAADLAVRTVGEVASTGVKMQAV